MKTALLPAALLLAATLPAQAAELNVAVQLPKLSVAEYHKPYVAVWIEDSNKQVVSNLALWYDAKMKNNEGEKWLKDMRQWWRKTGRTLTMPVDGVTGATQGPGQHQLNFTVGKAPLNNLESGDYTLRVETAREVGGREVVDIPFSWPQAKAATFNATGSTELGAVAVSIKP